MSNKTLNEFWEADPTLFNGLVLPTGLSAAILTPIIEDMSGRLCTYIQTGSRLKAEITNWSTYRSPDWARALDAMTEQYNPIYNYFREELGSEETAHHKGTKRSSSENIEETPATITNTGSVVAYDANAETETGKSVVSPGSTKNKREADPTKNYEIIEDLDATHFDKDTLEFVNRITQGNIGTTQTVSMIMEELRLRFENSIYERIAAEFEDKFCIQVY